MFNREFEVFRLVCYGRLEEAKTAAMVSSSEYFPNFVPAVANCNLKSTANLRRILLGIAVEDIME